MEDHKKAWYKVTHNPYPDRSGLSSIPRDQQIFIDMLYAEAALNNMRMQEAQLELYREFSERRNTSPAPAI